MLSVSEPGSDPALPRVLQPLELKLVALDPPRELPRPESDDLEDLEVEDLEVPEAEDREDPA
jgi:hypothetical protein